MTGFRQTAAVVTGASSGIGRAIAVALADAGVQRQIIHYCNNHAGAIETKSLVEAAGGTAKVVQCDLALADDRARLVTTSFDALGQIQTWVNNAGADVLTGDAAALDFRAKLDRLLAVDVAGTIEVSRQAANRLVSQSLEQPASMVFVGWDQAREGMEGDAGQLFGATKAAVMAFAASLAQTVAPAVRVNTVAPGWIQTDWGAGASPYWQRRAKAQALLGRWGTPADVARAVLYLADPMNTFVTGQTIDVNGGWNRRFESG